MENRTESFWTQLTPCPQQIAVPETLLKKRRTTEASREAKLAAAAKARQVSEMSVACPKTSWRLERS
jgi:hypothetical protein